MDNFEQKSIELYIQSRQVHFNAELRKLQAIFPTIKSHPNKNGWYILGDYEFMYYGGFLCVNGTNSDTDLWFYDQVGYGKFLIDIKEKERKQKEWESLSVWQKIKKIFNI